MDKESVNRQPVPDSENDDSLKISNLSIGMVVKNYKILCHLLNQEAKTGKAKQYQYDATNSLFTSLLVGRN